jgi:hypothetical protein
VDLTDDANSGFFQLDGIALAAETPIIVEPDQLINGELMWVSGEPGVFDDISILVSDPFGSAPVFALRLPDDSPSISSSMVVAGATAPPDEALDIADLLPESDTDDTPLPAGLFGGGDGGDAAPPSGDAGIGLTSLVAAGLIAGLDSETEQQLLAQT